MMAEHVDTFSLHETTWQGLTMTDKAAAQIRKLMKENPASQGLSLNIKQSGCAGFGYVIALIDNPTKEYLLFENNGAKLFVPLKAMPFIDGTEVDYVREGLNQVFKFNNPKAQHACGCGESFGI
ncbi:Fe-S cluster assembly scaffold SufA [Arsenophonus apicola]|uniref:Fe-S cluster assembly scaffold SufA n=1 Tax=Arsenophonus apicola TaxID=2879119 RepID=A0ABY8P837_9GAMM|nr:Fe-S cluster assembly scaffold SufA [Arsenophonus apicola]WGO84874.1 Fe-S cluster assembly scaffold SufA [Arsenophonus apicola]